MYSPEINSEFSHEPESSARGMLRIAETFLSRQGEGRLTGVPSFFVRTSGCNLRCWFCDTPYASWNPEGDQRTVDSIVSQALAEKVQHVVLTGGEPLLFSSLVQLNDRLRDAGCHVTIETAGTISRNITCDLLSLSPKFRSSGPDAAEFPAWNKRHEARRLPIETMRQLMDQSKESQVKFVVDSKKDYHELKSIVQGLEVDPDHVWVMPQGSTNEDLDKAAEWLKPWCDKEGFQYCDRMQIRWYGNRRGT